MRLALVAVAILALPGAVLAQSDLKSQPAPSASRIPAAAQPGQRTVDRKLEVDWGKVQEEKSLRAAAETRPTLQSKPTGELSDTHLPVLLPNIAEARAKMMVFPRPDSYAASLNLPGVLIEIFGTRIAKEAPPGQTESLSRRMKMTGSGYFIQRTETGYELSFERYGCSYNIAVTCDDPQTDDRCTKPDFITSLADAMTVFGGTPEGGE